MILEVRMPIKTQGTAMMAMRAPNALARRPDRIAPRERLVRTIASPRSRTTNPNMIMRRENNANVIDALAAMSRKYMCSESRLFRDQSGPLRDKADTALVFLRNLPDIAKSSAVIDELPRFGSHFLRVRYATN
jgi:hypothetical protein